MINENRVRICPFCSSSVEGNMFINLRCKCGAKYYWQSDIWAEWKNGKKGKEVRGDLWWKK